METLIMKCYPTSNKCSLSLKFEDYSSGVSDEVSEIHRQENIGLSSSSIRSLQLCLSLDTPRLR